MTENGKAKNNVRSAQLMELSRAIVDFCNLTDHVFHDLQGANPSEPYGTFLVQPIVHPIQGYKPLGWIIQTWDSTTERWIPCVVGREFRTGHIVFAQGTDNFVEAKEFGIGETLNFLHNMNGLMLHLEPETA